MMWEALTGVAIDLTVLTNAVAMDRIVAERNDPQADLVITNSTVEPESVRATGVFDPYPARVAKEIPDWLRAPDYSWMAFTAWPRAAMINWATLGRDPGKWPKRFEDLAAPEFHNQVVIASIQERTVTNYVTALRIAKGDEWTGQTLDRILDNGLRIYRIHQQTREALVREGYGVALVNSSNTHVFFLEGHPVGEAWLDQEAGGIGTNVDAHTIAVLRGGRQPEKARQFIDFLLSQEIQEFLARLYGETPVNPAAATGWVRPVSSLRRIPVEGREMVARFKDTQEFLRKKGFDLSDMDDPLVSSGRGGRRRDAERTVAMPGSS
jgi:iron(III) transport system substrate-binding protein